MGINANDLSQFLQGYLQEEDKKKTQKKIETLMKDKNYKVSTTVDPTTMEVKYSINPIDKMKEAQQASQMQMRQEQMKLIQARTQQILGGNGPEPDQQIVGPTGQSVGSRPAGSVFQPSQGQARKITPADLKANIQSIPKTIPFQGADIVPWQESPREAAEKAVREQFRGQFNTPSQGAPQQVPREQDRFKKYRDQLNPNEVLVLRGQDIVAVLQNEIDPNDIRL